MSTVEIGYSTDHGLTWRIAKVNPSTLTPDETGLPRGNGFLVVGRDGQVWNVRAAPNQIRLRPQGDPAPYDWEGVAFFSTSALCLMRRRRGDGAPDRSHILCRAAPTSDWVDMGTSKFLVGASGTRNWWAITYRTHELLWSPQDPRRWVKVEGKGLELGASTVSPQPGEDGDLFSLNADGSAVVRVDSSGHVTQTIPVSFEYTLDVNARGGTLAIAEADGVHVLKDGALKKVMAGCEVVDWRRNLRVGAGEGRGSKGEQ